METTDEPVRGPKIVLAAYALMLELYPTVRSFPKSQQFMIGRRIEDAGLELLTGLVAANKSGRKKPRLASVDMELEKLRLLVRLSFDLRFINIRKYELLSEKVDELGRMLGGWMKWSDEQKCHPRAGGAP